MSKPIKSVSGSLHEIQGKVIACKKCPRLVHYISGIRKQFPTYWCKPVPGFGDPNARILLLGLAPGRYGSNRTGRMFTGDASGKFLYKALYTLGLANQPEAIETNDGLMLKDTYITAAVRCAPPQNKPSLEEIHRCVSFVDEEIKMLPRLRVIVALGKIAHDAYLYSIKEKYSKFPFKHGAVHQWETGPAMIDIYHPSRQNTQTGLLTMPMFLDVLSKAKKMADQKNHLLNR